MSSTGIAPETQAKLKLWKKRDPTWPEWYVWSGGWYECDGENTRYCVWDELAPGDVVFDVGSYEGEWISRMVKKYPGCVYHGFEPAVRAYNVAKGRLGKFENVHLHNFGLGVTSGTFKLYDDQRDGASFIPGGKYGGQTGRDAEIVNVREFIEREKIERIALAAINIEGMEFELLPYVIGSGLIRRIERIMLQWHSVVENANAIQVGIQGALAKTHEMTWNHGAWEAWHLRSLSSGSPVEPLTVCTPATS